MVLLRSLGNFWKTLEMSWTNCEINLLLTWSENYVISSNTATDQEQTFPIAYTEFYVPVVTLSTQDNAKYNNWNQDSNL